MSDLFLRFASDFFKSLIEEPNKVMHCFLVHLFFSRRVDRALVDYRIYQLTQIYQYLPTPSDYVSFSIFRMTVRTFACMFDK